MRGEFLDVGGVRLYYYAAGTRGAGEPVILLHGFPTSGHLWAELVPLLPQGRRVVVVDLLGFGRSDRPGSAALSIRAHAQRVVALMDLLGIRSATLIGHHLGGAVAQAIAAFWPDRVNRLGLLASIGFDLTVSGTFALARAFRPLTLLVPARMLLRGLRADLLHRYSDSERGRHSVDHYLRPFTSSGGHRVLMRHLMALDECETVELSAALSKLAIPVALVWGADDHFVPPALARRLHSALPHATLDILNDVRHFTPEEAPERVANVLDNLLKR